MSRGGCGFEDGGAMEAVEPGSAVRFPEVEISLIGKEEETNKKKKTRKNHKIFPKGSILGFRERRVGNEPARPTPAGVPACPWPAHRDLRERSDPIPALVASRRECWSPTAVGGAGRQEGTGKRSCERSS